RVRDVERNEGDGGEHRAEQEGEGEILRPSVGLKERTARRQRSPPSQLADQENEQGNEPAFHGGSFFPSIRITSSRASRPISHATIPSGTGPTLKRAQPPGFSGCFAYWT